MTLHGPAAPGGTARAAPSNTGITPPNDVDGRAVHTLWAWDAHNPSHNARCGPGMPGHGNVSVEGAVELCSWLSALCSPVSSSPLSTRGKVGEGMQGGSR